MPTVVAAWVFLALITAVNVLGVSESVRERAGALAGSYLVSGLTRSIADALELEAFGVRVLERTR